MPYFFADRSGSTVRIEGADARHLAQALRARPGEQISVLEPPDRLLTVRLESVSPRLVTGEVVAEDEHHPEPAAKITIAAAMLPAPALELLLARCTEIGAAAFLLVSARRSVAKGVKPQRWAAICREAAMLAGRFRVPDVSGPLPLDEALNAAVEPYLLDRTGRRRLADLASPRDLTLFVGTERGWTPDEVELAGERVLRLGRRNMRAETAAMAALATALATRGD
jgi:16S rRNA (uracil1498-N3)-methyltransferase